MRSRKSSVTLYILLFLIQSVAVQDTCGPRFKEDFLMRVMVLMVWCRRRGVSVLQTCGERVA